MKQALTRRAALKLTGTAGLAGLFTRAGVKAPSANGSGLVLGARAPETAQTWANMAMPQKSARKALDLMERRRVPDQHQIFDADLASLKSVSPAMKKHIQTVRDSERYDWLQKLREVSWG